MRIAVYCALLLGLLVACDATAPGNTEQDKTDMLRIATFNIAMGLPEAGMLGRALAGTGDQRLQQVAAIVQRVRPDILLLNEFDYDPETDAAALLNAHYLARSQDGQPPIEYPYHFRAPVNTGVDSGFDLDKDGATGGPGDAWGYGSFAGQYGMLVLSRYPLVSGESRTFRKFRWSALPEARRPVVPGDGYFYSDEEWDALRLSSKSHWDLAFDIDGRSLRLLASHPTPPVFDGPENRNGLRNFDEIRFWAEYTRPATQALFIDDQGLAGPLQPGAAFVLAGDLNADPNDGDAVDGAIGQLLQAGWINADCVPASRGAQVAAGMQGGLNLQQRGDPAEDTADFNDRRTGNLRLDYLLPSADLDVLGCGVFWPALDEAGFELLGASDHRLVWLDLAR